MIQRHPLYWFDDGDTILHHEILNNHDYSGTLYRIHLSKFASVKSPEFSSSSQLVTEPGLDPSDDGLPKLESLQTTADGILERDILSNNHGCKYIVLGRERAINVNDLVALLDHVYGENVLSSKSDFNRITSILRITSPNQLDIPALYEEAIGYFIDLFPNDAQELSTFKCEFTEQAMVLALQHNIRQPQKALIYYLATQTHLDSDFSVPLPNQTTISTLSHTISSNLISFFTPLLFTPPPTSHMECTDALAGYWMPLVISPAIEDSAMGKPLQTLERMKNVNWTEYGICEECVRDKREEWTEEQSRVWKLMDEWIFESM
ncbi:hypothetical protein GGU10DRAFT_388255 [Lentinula aff. detonsa]|uniref:Uncharacterized protein n=1 Tax=Lentinula aff. detonsa TaxID=2804958 RepID=A0AA38NCM3_9AGAR|nr:hypothetical protein GGU10DRAFT_388255 [Lentinula aff. detonsa]